MNTSFTPNQLLLEDGSIFVGSSFGFPTAVAGEVVFNTGMVGYSPSRSKLWCPSDNKYSAGPAIRGSPCQKNNR